MGDEKSIVKELLESYEVITSIKKITDKVFLFSAMGKEFLLFAPNEEELYESPSIILINDEGLDFPHIMLQEKPLPNIEDLPDGKYRWICLYENESIVNSIVSYEDKILDALDRLFELLSISDIEKEREFQKEFMFYWNSKSVGELDYHVYLHQEKEFSCFDVFGGKQAVRLIEQGVDLTDIDYRDKDVRKWVKHLENDAYYIPIIDARGILPPHKGLNWDSNSIKNIIYPKQIEHISEATFQKLSTIVPKTQNIILVFGLRLQNVYNVFAILLKCNNLSFKHTILEKVLFDIVAVEPLYTVRKDYLFLNEVIGNDNSLCDKRVLVVGAGSLGSYVDFELVKNGVRNLCIYDGDKLEDANIMRWAYSGLGARGNKASTTGFLLGLLHPEIQVEAHDEKIDEEKLIIEANSTDIIIFTIGSSDEQLRFNHVLKSINCKAVVIYVWLEAGGEFSHILVVDYGKAGCYECLYTDSLGNRVNNRATKNSEGQIDARIVRNGCGGTRAAYGTSIILRTVSALLNTIKKILNQEIHSNVLFDISEESLEKSNVELPLEACGCCGNKNK